MICVRSWPVGLIWRLSLFVELIFLFYFNFFFFTSFRRLLDLQDLYLKCILVAGTFLSHLWGLLYICEKNDRRSNVFTNLHVQMSSCAGCQTCFQLKTLVVCNIKSYHCNQMPQLKNVLCNCVAVSLSFSSFIHIEIKRKETKKTMHNYVFTYFGHLLAYKSPKNMLYLTQVTNQWRLCFKTPLN